MNKQPDSLQFDVRKRIQDSFDEIKNELNESVVFVDPISSLVLSWGIPYDTLLNQYNIEQIFSLESVPPHISITSKKVVFFVSSFLYDSSKNIVSVLQSFPFLHCHVFTSFSESAHKSLPQKEEEPFARFSGLFSNLMKQNDNSPIVSIKVLPLLSCTSMFPGMFLLSSCNEAFPIVKSELTENAMRLTSEMVPDNMKIQLSALAHSLYDIFTWLGLKEEMYPLGPTARYVAKEINSISLTNNPLDIAQPHLTPATLLLVDRTLDMVSPSLHSDNLLDRIYNILSNEEISRDVKFPMGNLFPTMLPQVPPGGLSTVLGTLAHPSDKTSTSILEILATKRCAKNSSFSYCIREKEAITEIVKKIVELLTKEKLPFNLPKAGSSGVRQLLPLMEVFGKDRIIFYRYLSVLQCVSAVVIAIQESPKHNWDEILGIEKTLLLTLEDTSQSLISRVGEILGRPIPGTKFSLREIISLALLCYSIIGEKGFDEHDEKSFKEGIVKSLFETPQQDVQWLGNSVDSLNQYLIQLNKNENDKEKLSIEVTKSLNDLFNKFHFIGNARSNLTDYRSLLKPTNKGLSYVPLVQQIVNTVFDEKRELHDLDRLGSNASIGNILKTGFSKFGLGGLSKPAKSKPSENSIIVIFVIGGITFSEMREIRDALKTKSQVIIASTRIITPLSLYKMALNQ